MTCRTPDYEIKIGDTGTTLSMLLTDDAGAYPYLDGATVTLILTSAKSRDTEEFEMDIEDEETAEVRYPWADGFPSSAGDYFGEVHVDRGGGVVDVFPSTGNYLFRFLETL